MHQKNQTQCLTHRHSDKVEGLPVLLCYLRFHPFQWNHNVLLFCSVLFGFILSSGTKMHYAFTVLLTYSHLLFICTMFCLVLTYPPNATLVLCPRKPNFNTLIGVGTQWDIDVKIKLLQCFNFFFFPLIALLLLQWSDTNKVSKSHTLESQYEYIGIPEINTTD